MSFVFIIIINDYTKYSAHTSVQCLERLQMKMIRTNYNYRLLFPEQKKGRKNAYNLIVLCLKLLMML